MGLPGTSQPLYHLGQSDPLERCWQCLAPSVPHQHLLGVICERTDFFFFQSTSAFTCLGQVNLTHPLGLEHPKFDWTLLCTSVKLEKLQQTSVEQHGCQTCGCEAAGYSGNALPPLDVSAPSKNADPMVSQS